MATGIGVDPTKSGSTITSGRSSLDDRKIWGALYTPGIVSGAAVTTSASLMQYTVSEGVAAIKTADGQIVMAPVPATTVAAPAAPTSGSPRTDIVYVKQRFPADGDSNVVVGVASTLPTNAQELMRFSVPLNAANTNAATRTGFQNYAIPYGANLGVLYEYQYTTSGALPNGFGRFGQGTFYTPTDRRVRVSISAMMYAQNASAFSSATYCEYYFIPNIDGGDFVIWTSPGLHQAWATYNWQMDYNVTAGVHTTNFAMARMVGPGQPMTHFGTDGTGYGRRGITFRIEDVGVAV